MIRYLPFILILALTIYAFIDCLNTPEDEVRHLPKVVWVIIILLFSIVGPIVWFAAGKLRHVPGGGPARRREWVAPDDNPDFLDSLKDSFPKDDRGKDDRGKDESLLKDWEADLRRREEELRRRENGGPEDTPPAS